MTAAELAAHDSGPALVAYLGQPDASPAMCDLRMRGPRISGPNATVRAALVGGLVDGQSCFRAGGEKTLHCFANRLPASDLRDQARCRVVRIHVAASPFPEVRDHVAAVEEIVIKQGMNPHKR